MHVLTCALTVPVRTSVVIPKIYWRAIMNHCGIAIVMYETTPTYQ